MIMCMTDIVSAKPWIGASATSIILSNGEGEEGEGAKGAD